MTYRLLIADDDEELVKMLKSYLEIKGFEILTEGTDWKYWRNSQKIRI